MYKRVILGPNFPLLSNNQSACKKICKHNFLYFRSKRTNHRPSSDDILRLQQDHLRQCMKLDKSLHELRIKHENERHRAELEVISAQLDYWKKK